MYAIRSYYVFEHEQQQVGDPLAGGSTAEGEDPLVGQVEIFRGDIARFRVLLSGDFEEDPVAMVARGEVPQLNALRLHQPIANDPDGQQRAHRGVLPRITSDNGCYTKLLRTRGKANTLAQMR